MQKSNHYRVNFFLDAFLSWRKLPGGLKKSNKKAAQKAGNKIEAS
jgi:hypothetical protein